MVEALSRIQFAFTIAFHFIFVPLTVGLILMILIFEIRYFFKGDEKNIFVLAQVLSKISHVIIFDNSQTINNKI